MTAPKNNIFPPPRSIYVAFDAFPRRKGSSSHIASMVRALARDHAPVWLLCLGYGDMPGYQDEGEVIIHRFKEYHPNMLKRAAGFAGFVSGVVAAAGDGVELVVFRDPWGGCPALESGPDCAYVFEVNALPTWELPYTYPAVKKNLSLIAKIEDMERFCLAQADAIVTVSAVTGDALAGLGFAPGKIEVIPNSASREFLAAKPEDCPIKEIEQGKWFGYVGSLHPWQGVNTLIDAFAVIANEIPETRLAIIHNGRKAPIKPLKKRIRKRGLENRVLVHGPLPPAQLGPAMARLQFTTAPLAETARNTLQGCCPVKIIESMAAATPVLASDLRVCREIIDNNVNGKLADPDDTRAWARAIKNLFADENEITRMAAAARHKAQTRFARPLIHQALQKSFQAAKERAAGS